MSLSQNPSTLPEWLTVAQVSKHYQLSESTVHRLIKGKKFKATYFSQRCLRVNRASIDTYVQKNLVR
ncbi:helix-turn-helix domain-containing protein [Corynebacterium ulcerans]|uniref:helix-turn-helix domain-containing protein n=1 Tax=Corynebacterium ulcerans TaxID=65058 RepID=UPI000C769047|nr:helix-turn-helix domain-containing protein [Corynebacterium ulcerans]PLW02086.1 hypothetical protein BRL54_08895 [Corynebacterium ulcerans]